MQLDSLIVQVAIEAFEIEEPTDVLVGRKSNACVKIGGVTKIKSVLCSPVFSIQQAYEW